MPEGGKEEGGNNKQCPWGRFVPAVVPQILPEVSQSYLLSCEILMLSFQTLLLSHDLCKYLELQEHETLNCSTSQIHYDFKSLKRKNNHWKDLEQCQ